MNTADRNAIENYLMTKWTGAPDATWGIDSSGLWNDGSMWNRGVAPITRQATARFSDTISAPTSIIVDNSVTVNAIILDHSARYVIVGAGSVSLRATEESTLPLIAVLQGDHEFQVITNLGDDTTADISSGGTLTFNNRVQLNGNTFTKTGNGTLLLNNLLLTGGGTVNGLAGVLAGNGKILGNLRNQGGIISPGMSVASVPEASSLGSLLISIVLCGATCRARV